MTMQYFFKKAGKIFIRIAKVKSNMSIKIYATSTPINYTKLLKKFTLMNCHGRTDMLSNMMSKKSCSTSSILIALHCNPNSNMLDKSHVDILVQWSAEDCENVLGVTACFPMLQKINACFLWHWKAANTGIKINACDSFCGAFCTSDLPAFASSDWVLANPFSTNRKVHAFPFAFLTCMKWKHMTVQFCCMGGLWLVIWDIVSSARVVCSLVYCFAEPTSVTLSVGRNTTQAMLCHSFMICWHGTFASLWEYATASDVLSKAPSYQIGKSNTIIVVSNCFNRDPPTFFTRKLRV